ncbi:MAG: bifunctional hydroxymethylpyrimidine kinase/phosphomethylpyrimidine kinase [Actinomycetota bacterium]
MIYKALTIAGSDSGGGAGIQQDLKTFQALGVWGMTAITAVTVQNTVGVSGFVELPPETVADQIVAVASDIGVDAAKTGMLASAPIIEAVARAVRDTRIDRLVVDPVFISKHGDPLLHEGAVEALRVSILPLALVATPNAHEAAGLAGMAEVRTHAHQVEAGRAILALGARAVLVKGGHVEGADAVDVLVTQGEVREFGAPRLETPNTHGTGCMLSAAITAGLAKGLTLETAIGDAKEFVTGAIELSLAIGKGIGPVNPSWRLDAEKDLG